MEPPLFEHMGVAPKVLGYHEMFGKRFSTLFLTMLKSWIALKQKARIEGLQFVYKIYVRSEYSDEIRCDYALNKKKKKIKNKAFIKTKT